MILDQIRFLENRWRQLNNQLAMLRAGKWWHVGTTEECEGRLLLELDEIEYELGCIQRGDKIDNDSHHR